MEAKSVLLICSTTKNIKLSAQVFWNVTMCRWVSDSRRFEETQCLTNAGKH
jgi:hypothetical protein